MLGFIHHYYVCRYMQIQINGNRVTATWHIWLELSALFFLWQFSFFCISYMLKVLCNFYAEKITHTGKNSANSIVSLIRTLQINNSNDRKSQNGYPHHRSWNGASIIRKMEFPKKLETSSKRIHIYLFQNC